MFFIQNDEDYQKTIASNIICLKDNECEVWIAESTKTKLGDFYTSIHYHDGKLIAPTYYGTLHHIIDIKSGKIIALEALK